MDGQGGIVEYSDLLKRPLDAWKYLLMAIEDGEVALTMSMLTVNAVLIASTNEIHLEAFRQHPEYNSFRARLLPLRAGYLLDYKREREIYDSLIVPQLRQHVAPHATHVAALWAVLTRLLAVEGRALRRRCARQDRGRPDADGERRGSTPRARSRAGSAPSTARCCARAWREIAREFETQPEYEGLTGASAREIRTVLLDASQHPLHACLSPLGVFDQIEALSDKGDYEFLQHKPESGYHDHRDFLKQVRKEWLELLDREVRTSTGLVEESRYEELFERYITHVSLWLKGERYRDPHTGDYSDPDQKLLKRVESILEVKNARGVPAQHDQHDRRARDRSSGRAVRAHAHLPALRRAGEGSVLHRAPRADRDRRRPTCWRCFRTRQHAARPRRASTRAKRSSACSAWAIARTARAKRSAS